MRLWMNDRFYRQLMTRLLREERARHELDATQSEWLRTSQELYDEYYEAYSDKLLSRAERLCIVPPAPRTDERFEPGRWTGRPVLKRHLLTELGQKIREEQKARLDITAFWFTVIGAVALGLIGALMGLAAVVNR